jgi:parallel beta-helix repeat protein
MKTFFQRPAKLILKDLFISVLVVSIIIGLDRLTLTYFEDTPNEMTLGNCALENCETPFSITGINHFYASPKGQDNSTCDFNNPCLTFSHAETLAKPGDTIHLTGFLGNITVKTSGAPAAPINIVGEDVILSGLAVDGNYINVYNVEVTGAISHGIIVNSKHVLIQDSIVHHSVTENGINSECDTSGYWGSGIKARVGAEHVTFRGNIVFDNCGEGFGITRAVHVLLEDNIVRSNFSVGIYIDNSNHVIVKNNTVICDDTYLRNGNRMSGIVLAAEIYEGWGMQLHDVSVLNNKVDSCYDNIASWLTDDDSPSINLTIDGNISTNSVRRSIAIYSINQNVIVSNNIIDKPIYVAEEVINLGGLELIDNIVNTP